LWLVVRHRLDKIEGEVRWVRAHSQLVEAKKVDEAPFYRLRERIEKLESHTGVSGLEDELVQREIRKQSERDLR
jgi:hypothetical protein